MMDKARGITVKIKKDMFVGSVYRTLVVWMHYVNKNINQNDCRCLA